MTGRGALIAIAAAVLAAAPARGQAPPPTDAIDALLRSPPPPGAAPLDQSNVAPPPAERRPPAPSLSAPVNVDETGKSPDGPPTAADLAYDNRIRAGMAAAQGFLGPLDGGWTLIGAGRELYVLQLSDRNGEVQGAWRDPRRAGQADASGLIDEITRDGAEVRFRFATASGVLHAEAGDRWAGELSEGGRTTAVKLARRNP